MSTGLTATAGDTRVTLAWTDPNDQSISEYQYRILTPIDVEWRDWQTIAGSGTSTTTHAVTGLSTGTLYRFQVRARNGDGYSPPSEEARATPAEPLVLPDAPTGLSGTAGDGQVALTWNDPGDTSINAYQYRFRTPSDTEWRDWQTISGSDSSTTTHTVTGLTNGVMHRFQVRAGSDDGYGAPSAEATATPTLPGPAAPTGVKQKSGYRSISLTWNDPSDASITKYQYRVHPILQGVWLDWEDMDGSGATTTSYTVGDLAGGAPYAIQIRAVNANASGTESALVAAFVAKYVPGAPTGLAGTASTGSIALSWTDPTDTTITGYEYRLYPSDESEGQTWTGVPSSDASTTSYTITGLKAGVTYKVQVRAVNEDGDGTASAEISVSLPSGS